MKRTDVCTPLGSPSGLTSQRADVRTPSYLPNNSTHQLSQHVDRETGAAQDDPVVVWKRGYATGLTTGLLNPYPESLQVEGLNADGSVVVRDYIRGYFVEGDPGPFAKPGDSGAVVTDADGCVVGLIVALRTANRQDVQPADPAFVVPIHDLLRELALELVGPARPCTVV